MNLYMKNYGTWLGGALALVTLIGYAGIMPFFITPFEYIAIIGGTIGGTVAVHKELGKNIEFGKAFMPVLIIIVAFAILTMLISSLFYGFMSIGIMLQWLFFSTGIQLLLGISVLLGVGTWYMFEKAGKPGWGFLVPIYNLILMCEIAKKPTWWVAMFFVPIANIVFLIMMFNGISKSFGKDTGFTVGLVFLRQIFFAILGYGDAKYMDAPTGSDTIIDDI